MREILNVAFLVVGVLFGFFLFRAGEDPVSAEPSTPTDTTLSFVVTERAKLPPLTAVNLVCLTLSGEDNGPERN